MIFFTKIILVPLGAQWRASQPPCQPDLCVGTSEGPTSVALSLCSRHSCTNMRHVGRRTQWPRQAGPCFRFTGFGGLHAIFLNMHMTWLIHEWQAIRYCWCMLWSANMFYVTGNRFGHVPNTDNYWNFNLQSILASEIYVCVHSHMFQYFFYKATSLN
jgi:hypothetical protein